jgi:hypothetical protein
LAQPPETPPRELLERATFSSPRFTGERYAFALRVGYESGFEPQRPYEQRFPSGYADTLGGLMSP